MMSIIKGIIIIALLFAAFYGGMKYRQSHPVQATIIEKGADQLIDQGKQKAQDLQEKYLSNKPEQSQK
jgi:hypothetical protein